MPAASPLPAHLCAASVAALNAPFRSGGEAAGLPQRIKILNWGTNPVRPGGEKTILVDDSVAATLGANQEAVGIDLVPMDYEHQSFPGHKNFKPDPRHSPGSGRIECVPGEGVFLCGIEYTPNGVEHAASYRDVSAVVHHDKAGRPLWISCVALTQTGAVAGVEFAQALSLTTPPTKMDTEADTEKDMPFRNAMIELLGIKPKPESGGEISDEEILAAASKFAEKNMPAADKPEAEALSARILRVEGLLENQQRDALVARAGQEGKVIPLSPDLIKTTPVATLSAMIEGLQKGEVPFTAAAAATEKPSAPSIALSADEASAAKALNLTPEEFRTANPKA